MLPDYKRKALEQRRTDLIEEYEAVNAQLRRTLSDADELKLKRQQRHLEEQIAEVESELGQAPTAPAPSPSTQVAKAGPGSASQPDQLYGAGNRWAVLVGANAYEDAYHFGPLHVSVVDVEATREQLIAGGFDPARIRLLTDNTDEKPTRANILAALKSVADATEPDDLLLFYYSGHGDEAGGEATWWPAMAGTWCWATPRCRWRGSSRSWTPRRRAPRSSCWTPAIPAPTSARKAPSR